MVIDSYVHCGRDKYVPWAGLREAHMAAGVSGGLLVQHLGEFDNSYLIECAGRQPGLYRVVALVDHHRPHWRAELSVLAASEYVVGIRLEVGSDPGVWDAATAAADLGLAVLLFCRQAEMTWYQQAAHLAASYDDGLFVLTHLGTPAFDRPDVLSAFEPLEACASIVLQLSGLEMAGRYTRKQTEPLVRRLIECFGERNMIWGSNFPVDEVTAELRYVKSNPWGVDQSLITALVADTPTRLWRFDSTASRLASD